jgi:hypothetical protein
MAKVQLGPMVGQASGAIGGMVFSRNRGGVYVRRRAHPTVSQSSYAIAAKETLSLVSQAWQDQTAASQAAWKIWSANNPVMDRLGERITLAGNAAFIRVNALRMRIIGTMLLVPPVGDPPTPLTALTLSADLGAGNFQIDFEATPLGASERLVYWAAVSNGASQQYVENKLRLCGWSSPAQVSPYTGCETEIPGRLGTLQNGQLITIRGFVYDGATGLISLPLAATKVVTTT